MKCVCVQYVEAIRKLHNLYPDWKPKRTVYLTFVPDEEIGGAGMACFLSSELYKSIPGIALALDEGLASESETYSVFYGERLPWWVEVKATGPTGHGSRFIEDAAVGQIVKLASKALEFREGQRRILHGEEGAEDHSNCSHAVAAKKRKRNKKKLGDVTTLNITTLQAGVRAGESFTYNCVPPEARCSLDIRISPHVKPSSISEMLDTWCRECGVPQAGDGNGNGNKDSKGKQSHSLEWKYLQHNGQQGHALTSTNRKVNPWYGQFMDTLTDMGLKVEPEVFPAATDSRFLRLLGIRALGFSPMRNSEILLHENDEYLDETIFLEGIGIYVNLIKKLANYDPDTELV